jgi:hypothetical protein
LGLCAPAVCRSHIQLSQGSRGNGLPARRANAPCSCFRRPRAERSAPATAGRLPERAIFIRIPSFSWAVRSAAPASSLPSFSPPAKRIFTTECVPCDGVKIIKSRVFGNSFSENALRERRSARTDLRDSFTMAEPLQTNTKNGCDNQTYNNVRLSQPCSCNVRRPFALRARAGGLTKYAQSQSSGSRVQGFCSPQHLSFTFLFQVADFRQRFRVKLRLRAYGSGCIRHSSAFRRVATSRSARDSHPVPFLILPA